jgi:hypothetical protein
MMRRPVNACERRAVAARKRESEARVIDYPAKHRTRALAVAT